MALRAGTHIFCYSLCLIFLPLTFSLVVIGILVALLLFDALWDIRHSLDGISGGVAYIDMSDGQLQIAKDLTVVSGNGGNSEGNQTAGTVYLNDVKLRQISASWCSCLTKNNFQPTIRWRSFKLS